MAILIPDGQMDLGSCGAKADLLATMYVVKGPQLLLQLLLLSGQVHHLVVNFIIWWPILLFGGLLYHLAANVII